MPKISIIIPVYNVENYLVRTIKSLENQTIKDIEIILINDGSTDNSGKICDELYRNNKNIKVIHQENKGVSNARNAGIDIASGEYITFMDADDEIEVDMYELLLSNINQYNADISMCGLRIHYINGKIVEEFGTNKCIRMNKEEAILKLLRGNILNISMNTKIIKTEILKKCRFNKEIKINEDKLFFFECIMNSENLVSQDICKYIYWKRDGSASEELYSSKFWGIVEVADYIHLNIQKYYPKYTDISKRNTLLSRLYIFRMISRQNKIQEFKYQYDDLLEYFKNTKINEYKKNLNKSKMIELFIAKYIPLMYKKTLNIYDNYLK